MSTSRKLPEWRRLRVFALDPSLDRATATVNVARLVVRPPWDEGVAPGPVGEYLEVCDYDPASGCWYEPLNLMDPVVLAEDGLEPSTADPQFHQQMVYAVAMTTIGHFEKALGRRALWAERQVAETGERCFVPRLRIYPHAFRGQNAYYSPDKKALLFGYFPATATVQQGFQPGGMVFTCLSHDVIAHECTHALLDGVHGRYLEASNPDALAFHEAFADLVALFQRFTWPELLRSQIAQTRGDLGQQNLLGALAQEFGRATGRYGALRDALGTVDDSGQWHPVQPDPAALAATDECHERGAILVAAVFGAYLTIYTERVADLLRLADLLRGGEFRGPLPTELRDRLADEAAKAAGHVLTMCIRALDYCPPVDINFGDFLRALITADYDLVRDDDRGYRAAFIESFERWGIYPRDVRSMSVDDLLWDEIGGSALQALGADGLALREYVNAFADVWTMHGDRRQIALLGEACRKAVQQALERSSNAVHKALGLVPQPFDVQAVRPARRIGPDGQTQTDVVVEITQAKPGWVGQEGDPADPDFWFRGGCTLIVRPSNGAVRYCIFKRLDSDTRYEVQRSLCAKTFGRAGLTADVHGGREPLAVVHGGGRGGEWT